MALRVSAALALLYTCAADVREVLACEVPQGERFFTDPDEVGVDVTPPGRAGLALVELQRGDDSRPACEDYAVITLSITPPDDDRTPSDELGYLVEAAPGGTHFVGTLPFAVRPLGTTIYIDFGDPDAGDPLDISITVSAMDLGGNLGEPSEPLRITHPGVACACGVGMRHDSGAAPAALVLLFAAWAYRRSRGRPSPSL